MSEKQPNLVIWSHDGGAASIECEAVDIDIANCCMKTRLQSGETEIFPLSGVQRISVTAKKWVRKLSCSHSQSSE
jgi:hypothetical protein